MYQLVDKDGKVLRDLTEALRDWPPGQKLIYAEDFHSKKTLVLHMEKRIEKKVSGGRAIIVDTTPKISTRNSYGVEIEASNPRAYNELMVWVKEKLEPILQQA